MNEIVIMVLDISTSQLCFPANLHLLCCYALLLFWQAEIQLFYNPITSFRSCCHDRNIQGVGLDYDSHDFHV